MQKQFSLLPKIAALSVMAACAAPAMAQQAGSTIVNVGWFHLAPQDSSQGITGVSGVLSNTLNATGAGANAHSTIGNADTFGLALTQFFTDNIALTLDAGVPPTFHLKGQGSLAAQGEIGKAKQWSPALVAKYYFGGANDKFRPFVGFGATYVWYSDVQLSQGFQTYTNNLGVAPFTGTATAKLSSSLAPVFNVGASYNLTDRWSVSLSVSYIPLKTDATVTATGTSGTNVYKTRLTIDPIVSFLSVGYKF